jgi:mRNA interferase YafQ
MMRQPDYSGQFKRDVKQAQKRGKDMGKLKILLTLLMEGETLPASYLDHPLKGDWRGFRDAHIEPDWLLIYKIVNGEIDDVVRFERTGRHVDLFSI